ncbi:Two component system sensor response regulator/histidine kinase, PAS domain-containing [Desulfonema limicola]|uniref:histidine kinase n=1 Tax=Desulfonema limicola TaxID=45656 RepID=A0A975B909_9BACT|nr:PAS domain S-box protein [Desulfonema limicola]QTA81151.1 Two component system sensor response regulator/histidine kinase, PAS domain-containing [Desulfonema limicola]
MENNEISTSALINSLPDIIYRLDTKGKITFINDAVKKYGYLPEELINTDILELVHPDDRKKADCRIKERRTGERKTKSFEIRLLTKWKSAVPFELKYSEMQEYVPFLLNAEGLYNSETPKQKDYIGTQGIARDISHHKHIEQKLRESESQKKAILDSITINLAFVNENLEILWCNKAAADSVNKTPGEIIGCKCYELWGDPEKPCAGCPSVKAFKSRKTEHAVIYASDGTIWDEKGEPVFDDNGRITGILEIAHDITEKAVAEKALKESEEKYRILAENANDGIFIAQDGVVKFPNPAAQKLIGYSAKELSKIPFTNLIHPDDREMVFKRYEQRLKGENPPERYSFRIINKSGKELYVQLNAVMIKWESRPAALNFARDVTAEKKCEDQNLQIKKIEAIATLAGGIAHDFNNLLSVIMGNISLAEWKLAEDNSALQFLRQAEKAALRAKGLTSQLITFAKGGAGVKKTGSLGSIIQEIPDHIVNNSILNCKLYINDNLWPVEFDKDQMRQVFKHLLINAAEFSRPGSLITIKAENYTVSDSNSTKLPVPEGRYVKIIFQDKGIGIPEKNLVRIFDPYFTTKEMGTQKGTGLGLAIVRSIIHKHKGLIFAESKLDAGAAFHIYLPAYEDNLVNTWTKLPVPQAPGLPGKKILVMDDEEMIRELVCQILQKLKYESACAKDGMETVLMYQQAADSGRPYDAVILDLTIPEGKMGGCDTIKKLMEINPEVKSIVSSGYSNDPVFSDYKKYGFKGALPKPYTSRELKEELQRVLNS